MEDNSGTPEVIDLAGSPDRLVRVPGMTDPVPVGQLMSKAELTRSTQAYAQREREMREQFADADNLMRQLQEDPVAFHQELTEHLEASGLTPRQAARAASEIVEGAQGSPQMTMNESGQWGMQALTQRVEQLAQQNAALQAVMFEREANNTISAEIASARAHEAEIAKRLGREAKDLTEADLREVLKVANDLKLNDLKVAHKVWKHDQLVETAAGLREEVEVTKRKAEMPWLGGGSETGIAAPSKKLSLKEHFENNLKRL